MKSWTNFNTHKLFHIIRNQLQIANQKIAKFFFLCLFDNDIDLWHIWPSTWAICTRNTSKVKQEAVLMKTDQCNVCNCSGLTRLSTNFTFSYCAWSNNSMGLHHQESFKAYHLHQNFVPKVSSFTNKVTINQLW